MAATEEKKKLFGVISMSIIVFLAYTALAYKAFLELKK